MKKWEYFFQCMDRNGWMYWDDGRLIRNEDGTIRTTGDLGSRGWELIAVAVFDVGDETATACFKRPLEEDGQTG